MAQTVLDRSTQDNAMAGPFSVSVEEPIASASQRHVAPAEEVGEAKKLSPMATALLVMAAAIVLVLAATMGMMLILTDVSVLAAFGLGLYCAFWLGGGFGTIFGSAAVFRDNH